MSPIRRTRMTLSRATEAATRVEYLVASFEPGGSAKGLSPHRERVEPGEGNVYSSLVSGEPGDDTSIHAPVLDLDGLGARLVPSSTPGNHHLYLDNVRCSWADYRALLEALDRCGIIESGYAGASIERGATFVRKPGVVREDPREPESPPEPF